MTLYLFAIGFVSILSQVIILRELNVSFYGVELVYILAIAVWLLWTAVGAVVGRRSYTPSKTIIGYLFVVFALLIPADVAFVRAIRVIFAGVPGAYLPFGAQLAGLAIVLLPVGLILGLLFQWAAKIYVGHNRTLAAAYAIESLGGVIGGLASTLFLKFGVQNFTLAIVCSILASGIVLFHHPNGTKRLRYAGIIVFAIVLLLGVAREWIDSALTRVNHPTLVESCDSPHGRITVTRQQNQFVMYENDALAFETQSPAAEEFVHLAVIHADSLRNVLILGGGIEGTIREVLKYEPREIDYVQLNPVVISLANTHLPDGFKPPFDTKRVNVSIADPRQITINRGVYDLVLIGMADPVSGQSNRFFTVEFFEECATVLGHKGILALRLRSSENIWTRHLTYRNTSIFNALTSVFQDVVVVPGTTNIIVASDSPLRRDPQILAKRFANHGVQTRLVTPEYIAYLYTNDRFFDIAERLETTDIPANSDVRPVCYRYSSMIWLSKFFPAMVNIDVGSRGTSSQHNATRIGFLVLLTGFLFLVIRRRAGLRRAAMVAVGGFVGMVLETILILHYQVKAGVLFQNLGILLMVFMAGLAGGAWAILKTSKTPLLAPARVRRVWGSSLFAALSILNLVVVLLLRSNFPVHLLANSVLLFITGFLVAGVFAFASLSSVDDQKTIVSPLYSADLLGGFFGSLLGSLLLIPFLGMEQTAVLMTILSATALLLV